jgi:DNA-binding CsgD family transcriptional regulator
VEADDLIRAVVDTSDQVLRAGISAVLRSGGIEVVGLADGEEAVVLTDRSGLSERRGTRRVAVLEIADRIVVGAVLAAGVRGAILRGSAASAFVDAVTTVHCGHLWFDGNLFGVLPWNFAPVREPDLRTLTPREREVLTYIVAGCSNSRISALLGISVRTVKLHVSNIMAKLGVRSRAEVGAYVNRRLPMSAVDDLRPFDRVSDRVEAGFGRHASAFADCLAERGHELGANRRDDGLASGLAGSR